MRANFIKGMAAFSLAALVCASSVGSANAYFTTYVTAKGGYSVSWQHKEHISEQYSDWSKYIAITSEETSIPVFVRVKAFAGSTYELTYEGSDWTMGADGYCYYNGALPGGGTADGLRIGIANIPISPKESDSFNVVVIYETIPAVYASDGTTIDPASADWSQTLTSQTETTQVGEEAADE